MITIHKYELNLVDEQTLDILGLIKILTVKRQKEKIVLYVLANSETGDYRPLKIYIRGTGRNCEEMENKNYIGTVMTLNESLVWHIFSE